MCIQAALRCLDVLLQTQPPLPGMLHRAELAATLRRLEGSDLRSPTVRGPHRLTWCCAPASDAT